MNGFRGVPLPVERKDAMISTFGSWKVTRVEYFNDQSQALEAMGLSE